MRYYKEHRKEYLEYLQAQDVLNDVVNEYLVVFQKTQPHSPCYSGIQFSGIHNKVEDYVIEVESRHLKQRAEDAEKTLHLKKELLDLKEEELRKSRDIYDLLYTAKWIDNKRVKDIIRDLDLKGIYYSTSQIYEIIKRIKKEIERV